MAIASFKAGETIAAGDAVYVSSASLLYKAVGTSATQASVVGLAIDTGSVGTLIRVNTDSVYEGLSGLTPAEFQYLSIASAGALVNYSTWESEFTAHASNAYLTTVGRALTSNSIEINISLPVLVVYSP